MMAHISWHRRRFMTPVNMLFCWHLGLTMMLVWWALVLAYPASTFSVGASYAVYARICPDERFWACGYGIAALVGAIGTFAAWPPRVQIDPLRFGGLRMGSASLTASVHGMNAIFMLEAAPTGTGSGMYAIIMCGAWLLLRSEYERS